MRKKYLLVATLMLVFAWPVFYLIIKTDGLPRVHDEPPAAKQNVVPDIRTLEDSMNINPNFNNLINLSLAYINGKTPGKSIKILKQAIQLNPRSAVAYNNLGVAYTMLKQYRDGIDACTKALQIDSNYQLAKNNLKWATDEENKVFEAIKIQEKTPADKRDAAFYIGYGLNYLYTGNYNKSIEIWKKLLANEPGNATAIINVGVAFMMKEQYDDALVYFNKAIKLDPANQLAKNNQAWALDEIKNRKTTSMK